jgi:hypothetical protein
MSLRASTVSKTQPSRDLARDASGLEAKTKKAFQGIAPEGLFLYDAEPLRRFAPLAAIRRAAMAIAPGLCHESRHTPGHSRRSGDIG